MNAAFRSFGRVGHELVGLICGRVASWWVVLPFIGVFRHPVTGPAVPAVPARSRGAGGAADAGLGGLQVTEQTGQRTLVRTAQIAHTPNVTGYWLFVQVAECLLCAPA